MTDELVILKRVVSKLDEAGIPYMLTGSMAAAYYAEPRMTRDADLVVQLEAEDAPRLAALFGEEFGADADLLAAAISRRRMFNLIHIAAVVKVDFIVLKADPFRQEEFRRRRRVDFGGTELWIVAPEDLILSKLHWAKDTRSEMQLRDSKRLLAAQPGLDVQYLSKWAAYLGVTELLDEVRRA